MLAHEFMRNALLAGTPIALGCAVAGYLLALRGQVFAGDLLSHVAFVGAVAAVVVGVDQRSGLLVVTVLAAGALAVLGDRARADDLTVGTAFAATLGVGVLLLSFARAGDGLIGAHALFGSILGLSTGAARQSGAIALAVTVVLVAIARPLVFATLDPLVALARGVAVGRLGAAFLVALAVLVAQATQALGALLVLGLLAAPGAAALAVTARPFAGMALAGVLGVGSLWAGLALSYDVGWLAPSSAVVLVAAATALVCSTASGRMKRIVRRASAARS